MDVATLVPVVTSDRAQIVESLVREVGARGLRIATRLVGAADAEDALQEALLRSSDAGEVADRTGWFIRVLVNHCLSMQRRRRLWSVIGLGERVDPTPAADTQLEAAGAAAVLRGRVNSLPPMQRTVVQLRFGEDSSLAEIAGALGIGEASVKTHLQRALDRLRREMKRETP